MTSNKWKEYDTRTVDTKISRLGSDSCTLKMVIAVDDRLWKKIFNCIDWMKCHELLWIPC